MARGEDEASDFIDHVKSLKEDRLPERQFRVTIEINEILEEEVKDGDSQQREEPLIKVGGTAAADTFLDALPLLQNRLNENWSKAVELAGTID